MYIIDTLKLRAFADEVLHLTDPDEVKILLGEMLDIWPASIFPGLDELGEEQGLIKEHGLVVGLPPSIDINLLNVESDLSGLEVDLGDLPAVMAELDKMDLGRDATDELMARITDNLASGRISGGKPSPT